MNDLITIFKNDIYYLIDELEKKKIINNIFKDNISIDYSSKSKKGNISTNLLIILLKEKNNKVFDLKEFIENYFNNLNYIREIQIANAGFINLFFEKKFLVKNLENLYNKKINYFTDKKKKINIEFVSANPTGPVHVAHMRGAVLGDVLASVLESVGHNVTREYYVNDSGSQIKILGISLFKRYQQLFNIDIDILEDEYPGNYLIEIAKKIKYLDSNKWLKVYDENKRNKFFESFALNFLINNIKEDLSLIDVKFDKFTFESQIIDKKFIDKVFTYLDKKNLIYKGFLKKPLGDNLNKWQPRKQLLFRSTNFSDDSDRPFQKANGDWTYFANDSAYHYDKFKRGFDKLINVWGADHIGYISRMKSLVSAITNKENYLDILICQIVRLIKNEKILKMSKREGNFIAIKEIYDQVGKDALRYYMISTKSETPMDFNINKVIEKNKDNPVFYCQYAFARASSVVRKIHEFNNQSNINFSFKDFKISNVSEYEWEIILKLLSWPYILKTTAKTKQPHRIINFIEDLCSHFHSFWNKGKDNQSLRFIDEKDFDKTLTKLIWIQSFREVLKDAFGIIGIDSPETM